MATARERWLRRLIGDEKTSLVAAFRKQLRELGLQLDAAGIQRKEGKSMAGEAVKCWWLNKRKKQDGSEMTIADVPPEVVAALPENTPEEVAIVAMDIGETVAAAIESGTEPTTEAVAGVVAEKLGTVLEEVPAGGEPTTPEEQAATEISAALAEAGKALASSGSPDMAALVLAQAADNAALASAIKEMRDANKALAAKVDKLISAKPRQASKDAGTTLSDDTEIDGKTLKQIGQEFAKGLQTKETTFLGLPVTHKPA